MRVTNRLSEAGDGRQETVNLLVGPAGLIGATVVIGRTVDKVVEVRECLTKEKKSGVVSVINVITLSRMNLGLCDC